MGSLFITGTTSESTLPVSTTAFQKTLSAECACNNSYVLHINAAGSTVLGATYLSGSLAYNNEATRFGTISLNSSGNVFVGGNTTSTDLPLVNPVVSYLDLGGNDFDVGTVLAGLSPDLSTMVFSSYFNGPVAGSTLSAMSVSPVGRLVFAGYTNADTNFITTANAYPAECTCSSESGCRVRSPIRGKHRSYDRPTVGLF